MGCVGVWSDLSFFHSDFIFKLLNSSNHRDLKWISRARWYSIGILLVGPFSFFDSTNNPKFFLWTHGFNIDRGNTRPCHVSPFFRWIKTGPRHTRGTWVWPYEKLGSKTKEQNPLVGLSVQSKLYGPTIWTIHLRIPPCTHNSTRWLFFFSKTKMLIVYARIRLLSSPIAVKQKLVWNAEKSVQFNVGRSSWELMDQIAKSFLQQIWTIKNTFGWLKMLRTLVLDCKQAGHINLILSEKKVWGFEFSWK